MTRKENETEQAVDPKIPSTTKIMVVDDDSTFQFIFNKQIEKFGHFEIVNESKNGAEAIQFIKTALNEGTKLPELIVLDLNMPIMDGWDFLDEYGEIFGQAETIPVCILSSTINQADFDRANTYSTVKGFFSKPVTTEQLQTMKKLANSY
ncbi:MAG: response regulator [Flavobacteriales bacterium]|nr:response regulator [Flavobacteriales bacterium]